MKFRPQAALFSAALLTSSTAFADQIDFDLNDNVVSTGVVTELNDYANASLRYMYSDERGHLAQLGAAMTHDAGVHHFEVGANLGHLWAIHRPNGSYMSIGGKYALDLGSNISFLADAAYTPKVLAFGNIEGHYQFSSAIQFNLSPQMGFYTGYRYMRFHFDHNYDETFDSGFFIGMQARF